MIFLIEFYSGKKVDRSPRLDVWGFALIIQVYKRNKKYIFVLIQEVLTCEHAFGRAGGRPALDTEIRKFNPFGKSGQIVVNSRMKKYGEANQKGAKRSFASKIKI